MTHFLRHQLVVILKEISGFCCASDITGIPEIVALHLITTPVALLIRWNRVFVDMSKLESQKEVTSSENRS